ncbi:3-deoxy-8-phosphooctulonate synthase, partial [Paracoccaceae bacterium]|nr:3-deoxy-8-phosphooctulonate synthase [Paracoccaceae bacterium]
MEQKTIKVGKLKIGANHPIVFITGPCQLESRDHAMMMAEHIAQICGRTGSKFIFKSSYDKANRSSVSSARGIGMQEGLRILEDISRAFDCPVITDVHEAAQCDVAAQAVDVLQIPAFLSRQTDLLIAAGNTGKP